MDYSKVISKITAEVKDGSCEPFIIYRDNGGDWHCDRTHNQHGEAFDWVEGARMQDPFAIECTGKDFTKSNFTHIYDTVLSNRLWMEYHHTGKTVKDAENQQSLIKFYEDNTGKFSNRVTEYLTTIERPLAALVEMCPYRMITSLNALSYNNSLGQDAIDSIERNVNDRLHTYPDAPLIKKREINGYVEKQSVQLAGQLVIFAENAKADKPYMVCLCNWENMLGIEEYTNVLTTSDYVEAMALYADSIKEFVKILKIERLAYSKPGQMLTVANCIPDSMNESLKNKIIIIKPEALAHEYRRSEYQIKLCTGGFGTTRGARGSAIFCKDLYSGKESRFERSDVAGVANPNKLPAWALKKAKQMGVLKTLKQTKKPPNKKPSLLDRLEDAKGAAVAQNAVRNTDPKYRKYGDMEV